MWKESLTAQHPPILLHVPVAGRRDHAGIYVQNVGIVVGEVGG